MNLSHFIIALLLLILPLHSWAKQNVTSLPVSRMLIAIGYPDNHADWTERIGIGSYSYHPELVIYSKQGIMTYLFDHGYSPVPLKEGSPLAGIGRRYISKNQLSIVDLVDPTFDCEGKFAESHQRRHSGECVQQIIKSQAVAQYVRDYGFIYRFFAYIGHSRGGRGLSFGNYNNLVATVNLSELAEAYDGSYVPELVVLASCLSSEYFNFAQAFSSWPRRWTNRLPAPAIISTNKSTNWLSEDLKIVLKTLRLFTQLDGAALTKEKLIAQTWPPEVELQFGSR